MRLRLTPREDSFYDMFADSANNLVTGARLLVELISDGADREAIADKMRACEHAGDESTHAIMRRLNETFITPFDREDIYMLSGALDDIVDLIDDAARAMVMYDVHESTAYSRQFADVIQRMAVQLHEVVSVLERPSGIAPRLVEIHRLENEGDDIYHTAIAELFRDPTDPLTVIKWKEIYEKLEATCDRCESVAHIIESVILKNA